MSAHISVPQYCKNKSSDAVLNIKSHYGKCFVSHIANGEALEKVKDSFLNSDLLFDRIIHFSLTSFV